MARSGKTRTRTGRTTGTGTRRATGARIAGARFAGQTGSRTGQMRATTSRCHPATTTARTFWRTIHIMLPV